MNNTLILMARQASQNNKKKQGAKECKWALSWLQHKYIKTKF